MVVPTFGIGKKIKRANAMVFTPALGLLNRLACFINLTLVPQWL